MRYMAFKQLYDFLSDVWKLYAGYAVGDLTDKQLEAFQKEVEQIRQKYEGYPFVREVLVSLIEEVGRIANIQQKR